MTTEHGCNNWFQIQLFLVLSHLLLEVQHKKIWKNRIQTLLLIIFRLPSVVDFLSLSHSLPTSVARVLTVFLHPLLVVLTLSCRGPLCAVIEIRLVLTGSCKWSCLSNISRFHDVFRATWQNIESVITYPLDLVIIPNKLPYHKTKAQ